MSRDLIARSLATTATTTKTLPPVLEALGIEPIIPLRSSIASTNIPTIVSSFVTRGSLSIGDGGHGLYTRALSIPAHGGYEIDAVGGIWESMPMNGILTSGSHGIIGGVAATNDTAKIAGFISRASANYTLKFTQTSSPINMTAGVSKTLPSGSFIDFDGVYIQYNATNTSTSGASSAMSFSGTNIRVRKINIECMNQSQQYNGLKFSNSTNIWIEFPTITNFRWAGLSIFDGTAGTSSNIKITGSLTPLNRFGISWNANKVLLEDCVIGYDWSSTAEAIANNGVWNSSSLYYDGFIVGSGCTDMTLINCVATKCGQSGFYTGAVDDVKIYGGVYSNNYNKGIDIGPSSGSATNIKVYNAKVENNQTGNVNLFLVNGGSIVGCYITDTLGQFGIGLQKNTTGVVVSGCSVYGTGLKVFTEISAGVGVATGNYIIDLTDRGGSGTFQLGESNNNIVKGLSSTNGTQMQSAILFGGHTSSSPMIRAQGAGLYLRLADDSAFASVVAQGITANGGVIFNNSTTLGATLYKGTTILSAAATISSFATPVYVLTGSSGFTITVPDATLSNSNKMCIKFKNRSSASWTLTQANGSAVFYDTAPVSSISVAAGGVVEIQSDGTYWLIM